MTPQERNERIFTLIRMLSSLPETLVTPSDTSTEELFERIQEDLDTLRDLMKG